MNISRNWLENYVSCRDIGAHDFAEAMTLSGSKVETTEIPMEELKNIVVGKILSLCKHGNSDHMFICQVDVGGEKLQIVTGAQNVREGDLVPVALPDSVVAGGKAIQAGELRGELSQGMLCSLAELGLDLRDFPDALENGIWIIQEEAAQVGQDIRQITGLDDQVVEFEITPNRPDCLSLLGLAREVAATFGRPFAHEPDQIQVEAKCKDNLLDLLDVETPDPDLCPRYTARMVRKVKIGPSPAWMRQALRNCGVRPVNNIVDITNYVMIEYGQPMHAFDYRYVKGGKIIVRRANPGETLITLDGQERNLTPEMLVIADQSRAVGLAGVMGGENSEIVEDTVDVVFESANFLGSSVRKTAAALGMRTDASSKFEKGLDPMNTLPAVERACQLVEELGAGEVVEGVIDNLNYVPHPTVLALNAAKINKLLGTDIPAQTMTEILETIGFIVDGQQVTVPSWRGDVEHYTDLAEEVARFYGYNKIPTTLMRGDTTQGGFSPEEKLERQLGSLCRSMGYSEIITYSFISPTDLDKIRMPLQHPGRTTMKILNPLGEDSSIMRTTLLPSMLEILARNYNYRNPQGWFYELGRTYQAKTEGEEKGLAYEPKTLSLGAYGGEVDFFQMKGQVETLLAQLSIRQVEMVPDKENPSFHGGRCGKFLKDDGAYLGEMGQIHPLVAKAYGVDEPMYCALLDVTGLKVYSELAGTPLYTPLPKFPAMTRDIALICDQDCTIGQLDASIRRGGSQLLREVTLFDIYQGKGVPEGKKSVAFSLVLRSDQGSLTAGEADEEIATILKTLEAELSAVLR